MKKNHKRTPANRKNKKNIIPSFKTDSFAAFSYFFAALSAHSFAFLSLEITSCDIISAYLLLAS
ncbi:hypothetical protein [Xenorhabdus thailandensis]|uniref:hypothetical protein n=1 Tax=Xenorhabdus thailandensis TaxID=3136255 RepID=UPI0030F40FE9